MKIAACLIRAAMICSLAMAQRAVDFASKFMDSCKGDTAIHCVTIGPTLMEQLSKHTTTRREMNSLPRQYKSSGQLG